MIHDWNQESRIKNHEASAYVRARYTIRDEVITGDDSIDCSPGDGAHHISYAVRQSDSRSGCARGVAPMGWPLTELSRRNRLDCPFVAQGRSKATVAASSW